MMPIAKCECHDSVCSMGGFYVSDQGHRECNISHNHLFSNHITFKLAGSNDSAIHDYQSAQYVL